MLCRTLKSGIDSCRNEATRLTGDGSQDPAQDSAHPDVRGKLTAFDDYELRNWLMECIEDGSENFLCAVAEAALAANAEDYVFIRPVLLALRRKHNAKQGR